MLPESILQSDVLDIIFENRNKAYGAYALRKQYDRRILGSVTLVISCILIWFLFSFFRPPVNRTTATHLKPIEDTKLVEFKEEIRPPITQPKIPQPQVATVRNPTPIIVPDNKADTIPPPTTDEMEKAVIGLENKAGMDDDGTHPPVTDAKSGGIVDESKHNDEPEVYLTSEIMPKFHGGQEALIKFLRQNMRTPEEAMEPGTRVTVKVRFVVQKDGSIGEIEVIQSAGKVFDNEVVRVVNKMPNWTPGSQNGKDVAVYFTLPIVFETTEE
jgi:protein TonB